ncbi:MAG: hypothetical protein E6G68_00465 [Actinobacteria bacterium]|nr:MAG: hypothetical protein E6G68_00465 [Actinomycetota bacterium]
MRAGILRFARVAIAALALVGTMSACRLDVTLRAQVRHDGSGTFSIRFVLDKELVDIARTLSEDPLKALTTLPPDLTSAGWHVRRDTSGGGLTITVERPFANPADLNRAIADLRAGLASKQGPAARFFDLHVSRTSSFLRSATSAEGTIDLTSNGLLGKSNLPAATKKQLQSLLDQSASQFFRFTLVVQLPGGVSSATDNPTRVKGGIAEWAPQLGKVMAFKASSAAYNPALSVIGGGAAVAAALFVAAMARRRRVRGPAVASETPPAETPAPPP